MGLSDNEIISADELRQKQTSGTVFLLLDARGLPSYTQQHIEGALHGDSTPMEDIPKDRPIVTYCNANCSVSASLLYKLKQKGFTDVRAMVEGIQIWEKKGYPVIKKEGAAAAAQPGVPCGEDTPCTDS